MKINELIILARNGDFDARNMIVERYIPLVDRKIIKYQLRDEYIKSDLLVKLIEFVNNYVIGNIASPIFGYINIMLENYIRFIRNDETNISFSQIKGFYADFSDKVDEIIDYQSFLNDEYGFKNKKEMDIVIDSSVNNVHLKEIAETLGISYSRVDAMYSFGRRKLMEKYRVKRREKYEEYANENTRHLRKRRINRIVNY